MSGKRADERELGRWNPHWNYSLGGEPRSMCACPTGPYEGARLATLPRFCERCGGLVSEELARRVTAANAEALREMHERATATAHIKTPTSGAGR